MQEIGVFAAKSHLSQLLESVSRGVSFAITKHGHVIAFLSPAVVNPKSEVSETIMGIKTLRKKIAKRGVKLTFEEIQSMKKLGQK